MEYASELKKERERCIKKLVRNGFKRENLEFREKRYGTQRDEMARCAVAYKVLRKAEALKMSIYDVSTVLGCSQQNIVKCSYKCREAEKSDNYPFLRWVLNILK